MEVQHGRGIESVHVVNCELARQKLEFLTGSTGMFTFSMITGVKNGWLNAKVYGPAARKAWLGLVNQLDQDANVKDVCVGTNKGFTVQYYLDRERRVGDLHGQAPLLWSATALLR